jgi:hypothetical protein
VGKALTKWLTGKIILYFPKYLPLLYEFYRHLLSRSQEFFSSVFGVFGRRHFFCAISIVAAPYFGGELQTSATIFRQVSIIFHNNLNLHYKKLLLFNRIWIPSLYKRKIFWIDYSSFVRVFILSRMASKVICMHTDFEIFHIFKECIKMAVINFKSELNI